MGWFDRLGRTALVVLSLAVIYLFFTMIQTVDRLHLSNMKLLAALERIEARGGALPAARNTRGEAEKNTGTDIANAGYFDPAARIGGKLVSALFADAPGFNPLTMNEATASTIFSLCSATLAERDWQKPEIFKPMLAESWEISPDHLTYKIKLRKNAMWQAYTCPDTGKAIPAREITADDFVFTVEAIRNSDVDCAHLRSYYKDLASVEAVGILRFTGLYVDPFSAAARILFQKRQL